MIESENMDATIEDTDPGLKKSDEIGADPETGRRSPVGSGVTQEKEGAGNIKMESEMGREIKGISNEAGVERSIGRGEVGALNLISIS